MRLTNKDNPIFSKSITHFLKSGLLKVAIVGTTLLTTIPLQNNLVQADDSTFNMSYLFFGNTNTFIKAVDSTQGHLDVISPSYFDLNADGTLALSAKFDPVFIEEMKERNIKVVPFLSNHWDRKVGRAALENRELLSDQIAKVIIDYNLDGINVDIENVTAPDQENYTDFVRLLREKLPAGKEISVAVAANPKNWDQGWHGSYNNLELANYADYLMVMAYDESYYSGDPGPVASLPWVEDSIEAILSEGVPSEKVVLGLPFFGRYWNSSETIGGYGASNHQIESLIKKYNGKIIYDEVGQAPKAIFKIEENGLKSVISGRTLTPGTYEAWFEDNQSLKKKIELVNKYNLKGTGSWSLGQENPDLWNAFGVWMASDKAEQPRETIVLGDSEELLAFPFDDAKNHWAYDQIFYVKQKGWFSGKTESTFGPGESLTRAQAAVVFTRVLDLKPLEPIGHSFKDVATDHWAKESIEIAKQHGVFNGKSDGTFGAEEALTRGQMAMVIDNTFHDTYDMSKAGVNPNFSDVARSLTAYNAILSMKSQKIFSGYSDGTFRPNTSVSRSQMAVVLTNLNDRISLKKGEVVNDSLLKKGNQGPSVTLLQINLKKLGLFDRKATGYFGEITKDAVLTFQSQSSLTQDGVVGPKTISKMRQVIARNTANTSTGQVDSYKETNYHTHIIESGDTIWDLSIQYGIPQAELLEVNQFTAHSRLTIGQTIIVPVYNIPVQETKGAKYGEYLDWWTEAQYVFPIDAIAKVTDFQTGKSFMIKRTIGANHADVEPLTANDTRIIKDIWGSFNWNERAVIIEVDNRKLAASMTSLPHGIQYITDNNFNGHTDVHFKNSTRHKDGQITAGHQEQIRIAAGLE